MNLVCPYCLNEKIRKKGYYFVKHSSKRLRRYYCTSCKKSYSRQTRHPTYRQHRPDLNKPILDLYTNSVTQRGSAKILRCSRLTIERKLNWLGVQAKKKLNEVKYNSKEIQFDEMETIERTKLLPVTIALAVDENYNILSAKVGRIPSKGPLADLSVKKYGPRPSERPKALEGLFLDLKQKLNKAPISIISDQSPHYRSVVERHFPETNYLQFNSRQKIDKKREMPFLKEQKQIFDPMFQINQRCAMIRANLKRLTRRSWCVTQKIENLQRDLLIYQAVNNGLKII